MKGCFRKLLSFWYSAFSFHAGLPPVCESGAGPLQKQRAVPLVQLTLLSFLSLKSRRALNRRRAEM
jgi:hypothetical protein